MVSDVFPTPVSLCWKIWHNSFYLVGGFTFLFGSLCYLPSASKYIAGGWLFTIGSAAFTFCDIFEWWKNNRVGCAFDSKYKIAYQKHVESKGFPSLSSPEYSSPYWRFKRSEQGLNFFASVVGSALYLIGSVLFIPSTNGVILGTWIFIIGSAFIAFSQSWKLYRSGCSTQDDHVSSTNSKKSADSYFRCSTVFSDKPVFGIDFGAGMGGVFYFFGSVYFLNDSTLLLASILFTLGGASFLVSGLCMSYKYFCTKNTADALLNNIV